MCVARRLTHNRAMSRIDDSSTRPPSSRTSRRAAETTANGGHRSQTPVRRMLRWALRRGQPVPGNTVQLLRGGHAFFPALIAAIDQAAFLVIL